MSDMYYAVWIYRMSAVVVQLRPQQHKCTRKIKEQKRTELNKIKIKAVVDKNL